MFSQGSKNMNIQQQQVAKAKKQSVWDLRRQRARQFDDGKKYIMKTKPTVQPTQPTQSNIPTHFTPRSAGVSGFVQGYTPKFAPKYTQRPGVHSSDQKHIFDTLANVDALNKRKVKTMACRHTKKQQDGTWSVCKFADQCTYAHSLQELNILSCLFDEQCNKYNNCRYHHPSKETIEEWRKRTATPAPELPSTNPCIPPSTRAAKMRQTISTEQKKVQLIKKTIYEHLRHEEDESEEDEPKEDKPKEDKPKEDKPKEDKPKEEDEPKEDKPKEDKPKEDKPKEEDEPKERQEKQVIRVPSKELAITAVIAAYNSGIYDFHIIIEE